MPHGSETRSHSIVNGRMLVNSVGIEANAIIRPFYENFGNVSFNSYKIHLVYRQKQKETE